MIFNKHLNRLMEIQIVRDLMERHKLRGKLLADKGDESFILYRLPYVINFYDNLIENYLEIYISDLDTSLMFTEGSAWACCVNMGLQSLEELRRRNFDAHPQNEIFLSEGSQKMYGLQVTLEAIDMLLPLLEARGGLASMRDGTFDRMFDFKDSVKPMWPGLREKYLSCINANDVST